MDIFAQLIRDEGMTLSPYRDSVGKLTIGVGRNLTAKGISEDEARAMLARDVADAERELNVNVYFYSRLDAVRQAALVNMCFNLGIAGLLGFHETLYLLAGGDYAGAAEEMLKSRWATQVGDRAKRLAEQIRSGEWQ